MDSPKGKEGEIVYDSTDFVIGQKPEWSRYSDAMTE